MTARTLLPSSIVILSLAYNNISDLNEVSSVCRYIATEHYNLRSASSHNRLFPARTSHLTDANFITRLLYKDSYYPVPDRSGDRVLFLINFFVSFFFVYLYLSFFVSLLARLRENGLTDLHEIFRVGAE